MRRKILSFTFLIWVLPLVFLMGAQRPNIILCMTDDQGWGDTGYNGHPDLKTPHLDQMHREGVTFSRFYSAAAMCSPTRGSCYTGRHPYRYGITYAMKGMLEPQEVTITSLLKKQGYRTGHFGKWHLGTLSRKKGDQKRWGSYLKNPVRYYCPPWERDIDVCFVAESKVPTWNPLIDPGPITKKEKSKSLGITKPYGNDYFAGPDLKIVENTDGDSSRVIMDRAIDFMREATSNKEPFFAVIWFHAPHSPVVGGANYLKLYEQYPEHTRHYYACLTAMDEQLGRMRRELDELGVGRDTMLWFCSDNGPARQGSPRHVGSAKNLKGFKLSIHEGGIRVPGLMVWPAKIREPRQVNTPCFTTDYFPTILDALDLQLPEGRIYDGTSLLPFVLGEKTKRQKPLGFLNKEGKEAAWMEHQYKLIEDRKSVQLYDMTTDPGEENNLALEKPEITSRLQRDLKKWKDGVMADLAAIDESKN